MLSLCYAPDRATTDFLFNETKMCLYTNYFTKMEKSVPNPQFKSFLIFCPRERTHGCLAEESHRATVFLHESSGEGKVGPGIIQ